MPSCFSSLLNLRLAKPSGSGIRLERFDATRLTAFRDLRAFNKRMAQLAGNSARESFPHFSKGVKVNWIQYIRRRQSQYESDWDRIEPRINRVSTLTPQSRKPPAC